MPKDHATKHSFSWQGAFDRNIGWLTEWEQTALRGKTVAIAGVGGVGGAHLLALTRLGIGGFILADFDTFDLANFNRQVGASMSTLGRPKLDVMAEMALDINPELRITRFHEGLTTENMDRFLETADMFVDGLDFFVMDIRQEVFARCGELRIPSVTAAPIGMGTGFIAFMPGGQTFEEYFRLEGQPENEQYLRFLLGVAPSGMHRPYLVDPSRINLEERRGPSTTVGCGLCAAMVGAQAVRILLQRGGVRPAPFHHHFDAYLGKMVTTRLRWGNGGLLQRIKLGLARKGIAAAVNSSASKVPALEAHGHAEGQDKTILSILDAARWTPSGDNGQPWKFDIRHGDDEDTSVGVSLPHVTEYNPYEYRSFQPNIMSCGMLLESMDIAASAFGRALEWSLEEGTDMLNIRVRFPVAPGRATSPLLGALSARSVNRTPYRMRPLTHTEKASLQKAASPELWVSWRESKSQKMAWARLGARATDIRLRMSEAFEVHRKVIDWSPGHSATGLPSRALGLNGPTIKMMRWAMKGWGRMHAMNKLLGTSAAALQLDLLPGLGSAAFMLLGDAQSEWREDMVEEPGDRMRRLLGAGRAVQRVWLTATRMGLSMQPNTATLIFSHYGATDAPFTSDEQVRRKASALADAFKSQVREGEGEGHILFLARIGEPKGMPPIERSVRKSVAELMR